MSHLTATTSAAVASSVTAPEQCTHVSTDTIVTFTSAFNLDTLRQMLGSYFSFESMVSGHECYGLSTVGVRFHGLWVMADAVERCNAVARQLSVGLPEETGAVDVHAFDIGSEIVQDYMDMRNSSPDYDDPFLDEEYEARIAREHGEYEVIKAQYGAEAADIYLYGIDYGDEWRERDQRVRDERADSAETFEEALERRALCVR